MRGWGREERKQSDVSAYSRAKKERIVTKMLATYANLPNNQRQHPSIAAQRNAKRHAFDDSLDAMFEKERKSLDSD